MDEIKGVIFFGDSVLAGTGASQRENCCAKLIKDALKIPVSLRSRNWNTTRDGLNRLEDDVLKQSAFSHIVILFGNNDSWLTASGESKVPLEEFRENLIEIAARIKSNKQTSLLCNLQLINGKVFLQQFPELVNYCRNTHMTAEKIQIQYNDLIEDVAKISDTKLINIRTKLEKLSENSIAEDGIHPNDQGHKIIAGTILQSLQELDPELKISNGVYKT